MLSRGRIGELKKLTPILNRSTKTAFSHLAEGKGRVIVASCRPDEGSVGIGGDEKWAITHAYWKIARRAGSSRRNNLDE